MRTWRILLAAFLLVHAGVADAQWASPGERGRPGSRGSERIEPALTLGKNGKATGQLGMDSGAAAGARVTVQNPSATSAYNFNLPATVGTVGQCLASAGGGSSAMTWAGCLSAIAAGDVISNITAGSAVPVGNTLTATIDAAISSVRGAFLERGGSGWAGLPPSSSVGAVLFSNGTGADPSYGLLSFIPAAGMKCDGSTNDDTAYGNALASNITVALPHGTCILTVPRTVTADGQRILGAGQQGTILKYPSGSYDALTFSGCTGCGVQDVTIDTSSASGGNALVLSGVSQFWSSNLEVPGAWNGVSITQVHVGWFLGLMVTNARGAYGLSWTGAGATRSDILNIYGFSITASNGNTTTNNIVMDGNVHTLRLVDGATQRGNIALLVQNTVGGSLDPSGIQAVEYETNIQNGEAVRLVNGSNYHFWYTYGNNTAGVTDGIYVGPLVNNVQIDMPELVGIGQNGINVQGTNVTIRGGTISGTSQSSSGTYSGILLGPAASEVIIEAVNSERQGSKAAYGLDIQPGATHVTSTNSHYGGTVAPYRNLAGAWPCDVEIRDSVNIYGTSRCFEGNGSTLERAPQVEDTAQNLALQANNFATTWSLTNLGTPAQNVTPDPLGGAAGWSITPNTTSTGLFNISQNPSVADNTLYVQSMYFQTGVVYQYLRETFVDKANNSSNIVCTPTGSGLPSVNGTGATVWGQIRQVAYGWYRCQQVVFSASGATTPAIRYSINNASSGAASFAGSTSQSLNIFGAQIEALPIQHTTTGTISALSSSLTVGSATDCTVGNQVFVAGAGAAGANLVTPISAVSGTTVTTSTAAATGVTTAAAVCFRPTLASAFVPTATVAATRPAGSTSLQPYITGHPVSRSTPPAVSTGAGDCGTSPVPAAWNTDDVGRITVGSSTNGGHCTVTFALGAWTNAPVCSVQNETSGARTVFPVPTTTTLVITAATTLTAADVLSYSCRGGQ